MGRAASCLLILGPWLLLAGALPLGCDRPASPPDPRATQVAAAEGQTQSATPAPAATSPTPTPGNDDLDEFKQALLHKVDRARWRGPKAQRHASERPAGPAGAILHLPDGQDVHATILVKEPDGTVRSECVSSAAEVSALVEEIRKGRTP
jgi:hypothetical protein